MTKEYRCKITASFKSKVAVETLNNEKNLADLS